MAVNVNDKIRKLSPAQRKKVGARAEDLVAEEKVLRELRRARKLTQVRIAKVLGITQDSVSRLEKRSDLLLSTLRKTIKAMGGNLSLVAEFPDRAPVVLSGIAEDDPPLKLAGWKDDFLGKPTPKGTTPLERIPELLFHSVAICPINRITSAPSPDQFGDFRGGG
jgi:transcriptional regulator with XRE-family HTH domain